jgi:hypothetical protein
VKVGVWCAESARIAGLVFFKEIINFKIYVQVILEQFFPQLREEERFYDWFQQDSGTAHSAHMSVQALSDVFRDRITNSDIWPARSPALNPCDFFFRGCLKDKVYNSSSPTEEELKENICREIIPSEPLPPM